MSKLWINIDSNGLNKREWGILGKIGGRVTPCDIDKIFGCSYPRLKTNTYYYNPACHMFNMSSRGSCETVLHHVVNSGSDTGKSSLGAVKSLVEKYGSNVNGGERGCKGNTYTNTSAFTGSFSSCLNTASRFNYIELVKYLLSRREIDVNLGDPTPLHTACSFKHIEVVKCLLIHPRIDPNKGIGNEKKTDLYDVELQTPLHEACRRNSLDIVKILLSHSRIDPRIRDFESMKLCYEFTSNDEIKKRVITHLEEKMGFKVKEKEKEEEEEETKISKCPPHSFKKFDESTIFCECCGSSKVIKRK